VGGHCKRELEVGGWASCVGIGCAGAGLGIGPPRGVEGCQ
jgi:hypothetical protein